MTILPGDLLTETDLLPDGVTKINKCIKNASEALEKANQGIDNADLALKVATEPVTPDETLMFVVGKNKFDKTNVIIDTFVNHMNGSLISNTSYVSSSYIQVIPGKTYVRNFSHSYALYDITKNFISGKAAESNTSISTTITIPIGISFIRVTVSKTLLNTFQFEQGTQPTTYEPFGCKILDKYNKYTVLGTSNIEDSAITKEKTTSDFLILDIKNLFNKDTVNIDKFVDWTNGNFVSNVNYNASDYIVVKPNTKYTRTQDNHIAYYDKHKTFISGQQMSGSKTITTPANTMYVRVSISKTMQLSDYQFEIGDSETIYTPHVYRIPDRSGGIPIIYDTNLSNWAGKIVDFLGDSITEQWKWPNLVKESLGFSKVVNHGIGGTRVSGSASNAFHQDARINALSNADLYVVMGGTNDWAQNVPLGTANSLDTETYYGAYRTVLIKMITRFPDKRIIVMTSPFGKLPNRSGWNDTTGLKNNLGFTIFEYGQVAKNVAAEFGIPYVDIRGDSGWNDINLSIYMQNEEGNMIHPNEVGGKRIAELLIGKLKSIEPILS
ncbi:SGNH/GDSL hydrolase family protein [Bacillus cereus]|uniref:SGNH/GDSL hydrolase family protein n=1 Tax=Bacillus cereus TaxID=1396 RepID=UPI0009957661|nr:SGNH/GDSL hydrolase family protein [Bacillus cereus]OOZ97601.1 hypothetical protein BHL51_18655 [Bacillus cereus]PRC98130.1 SGNH/GDSL hydrolase family protein [Bacillus cereus]PRD03362.1 SGNH/GDSL hydrolase family protein [Bacillus cereus]